MGLPKWTSPLAVIAYNAILTSRKATAFETLMTQQFVLPDQFVALRLYYMLSYI